MIAAYFIYFGSLLGFIFCIANLIDYSKIKFVNLFYSLASLAFCGTLYLSVQLMKDLANGF